ncbi:hypothetical protein BJV78DRAFT_1224350 [Lactifluus subvellereus]|nr:hypothetical protein BJV78DRAFT_1224350 [Lactifluus subvellereus]
MTASSSSSSPPISPPSLLQSSFSSTADTRNVEPPPTPHTPPRGRSRYPSSLAHDGLRVPLHRRGTSNTYERLEDLLKEAGYKETRVFTPETERHREYEREHGEGRETGGRARSGVDTVVGFLAGLVLGQGDGQRTDMKGPQSDRVSQATLVGSSAHRHRAAIDISPTVRASSSRARGTLGHPLRPSGVTDSGRLSDVPVSPARAYLRHMASAPNIPRRRLLRAHTPIPVAKKSTTSLKDGFRAQSTPPPPMPPSWLETVARAVLGFPGARIGGRNDTDSRALPVHPPEQSRSEHSSQATSRSGTVRGCGRTRAKHPASALEDVTARLRGRSTPSLPTSSDLLQPPTFLAMRSEVSIGQVDKINVVCRSAPASRSSSLARRKPGSDSLATSVLGNFSTGSVRRKGKAHQTTSVNPWPKSGKDLADRGPSLSVRLEDDSSTLHPPGERDYDSSEDEDEDEVDLSKLLVHPRRQQSIKSLRRHLERTFKSRGAGAGVSATALDDGGRMRRGSVNDGDWGVLVVPGPERDSRTSQRRRAIPASWTQRSGGSRR